MPHAVPSDPEHRPASQPRPPVGARSWGPSADAATSTSTSTSICSCCGGRATSGPDGVAPHGRRALLVAGATAAVGAIGVAAARPAEAAAGGTMVLGRANSAGSALTTLVSSSTGNVLYVRGTAGCGVYGEAALSSKWGTRGRNAATGTGTGGAVLAEGLANHGALGTTRSAARYGVWGRHDAAATASVLNAGAGAAVRAQGRHNMGMFADTLPSVDGVPAIMALGGDGEFHGIALLAGGTSYLDGNACALRNLVGVLGTSDQGADELEYAPVVSGELDWHTVTDAVTLTNGAATVDLTHDYGGVYGSFVKSVDMTTLRISLTPVGVAMPNLHATFNGQSGATTFGVAGGVGSGTVHFTVTAQRVPVTLATGDTASAAAARVAAGAAAPRTTTPGRSRVTRTPGVRGR